MGFVVFYIFIAIIFLIAVIYLCIIKPIRNKSQFSVKELSIRVGMKESDMLNICGTPSKTVIIDETTKLITYSMDEWKGFLFGGTKRHEITATIKNGIITHVSQ